MPADKKAPVPDTLPTLILEDKVPVHDLDGLHYGQLHSNFWWENNTSKFNSNSTPRRF